MTPSASTPRPLRILLIAEAANPEWTSVPLEGWSNARALAAQPELSVHVVTQTRNRPAFERAGLVEGTDFTAIDTEAVTTPAYRLLTRLRGGANKGWTTVTAFSAVSYYYFEHILWKQFGRDIQAGAFDIVHRVTPLSPTAPSLLAKWCKNAGTPFVLGPLNGGLPWPPGFDSVRRQEKEWLSYVRSAYKLMPGYKGTREHAAAIIVGSLETRRQVPPQYHDKCVYILENGIDPARFPHHRTRQATRPLRGVFVGRLVPYKGADMALEAAKTLLSQGALTLDIVGDGPQKPDLEKIVHDNQLEESTRFHGQIPHEQVSDMLLNADLFVFPSIREFGGAAVLEAMAVGLTPVIADYGGPAELVTDSTGIKIPMGHRDEMVENLRDILTRLVKVAEHHRLHGPGRLSARPLPLHLERQGSPDRRGLQLDPRQHPQTHLLLKLIPNLPKTPSSNNPIDPASPHSLKASPRKQSDISFIIRRSLEHYNTYNRNARQAPFSKPHHGW